MKRSELADWLEMLPSTTNLVYWSEGERAAFAEAAAIIRASIEQPIETAPKDGTEILLLGPYKSSGYFPCVGYWQREDNSEGDWNEVSGGLILDQPTHWMPIREVSNEAK